MACPWPDRQLEPALAAHTFVLLIRGSQVRILPGALGDDMREHEKGCNPVGSGLRRSLPVRRPARSRSGSHGASWPDFGLIGGSGV